MEIRLDTHGPDKLATKVFFSDEKGFEVASVIVMGKKDCVLLDAQWTLSNAHRVVAEILETGLNLTHIFLTHAHPDHYLGAKVIADAFPQAKVVALPYDVELISKQFEGKIEAWEDEIGKNNCPKELPEIKPLENNYIELEGERIEIMPKIMGDLKYNSVVWIPSIKTLYGSDVLFNQAHPFTNEVTAEERQQWVKDIEQLETLGAEVIIPGHQKPGMPFDESSFKFMKDYLAATEEALEKTNSVAEFYYFMVQRFPDANLFISNYMNANVFKGNLEWDWRED